MSKVSCPERLELMDTVHELLLHKITLLEGLVFRAESMESMAQNLINLVRKGVNNVYRNAGKLSSLQAFNTVNQRDSHSMKEDSQAMKVIAVMTMLFLPTTAVAVSILLLLPHPVSYMLKQIDNFWILIF